MRFIATTADDLKARVQAGSFRADLFYRLGTVELRVPPLRERMEDIALLSSTILEKHASRLDRALPVLSTEAVTLLERQRWPGNVRELESALLGALVTAPNAARLDVKCFEEIFAASNMAAASTTWSRPDLLTRSLEEWRLELDREYLSRLFILRQGDLRAMSKELGVKSSKLYDWFRKVELNIRELRRGLSPITSQ